MELEELARGAAEGKYRGFQPITKYVSNELKKMKDRGSNLEKILKCLLSLISKDRIVLFQTPQRRTDNVSDGGS